MVSIIVSCYKGQSLWQGFGKSLGSPALGLSRVLAPGDVPDLERLVHLHFKGHSSLQLTKQNLVMPQLSCHSISIPNNPSDEGRHLGTREAALPLFYKAVKIAQSSVTLLCWLWVHQELHALVTELTPD